MEHYESSVYDTELNRAKSLLYDFEESLPKNVIKIIKFCVDKGIQLTLSRNAKVLSCKDARNNRLRLGHVGIPLYDELRSIVFKGFTKTGEEKIIAVHCRGHMIISENRLVEICDLNNFPAIMDSCELKDRFGMDLGTVNPFMTLINSNESVINIFDNGLTEPITFFPKTMMTNAGVHTWGIEFDPVLLINSFKEKIIDCVAVEKNDEKNTKYIDMPQFNNPKSIGIIVGHESNAGAFIWNTIKNQFDNLLCGYSNGSISLPLVKIIHLRTMGLSTQVEQKEQTIINSLFDAIRSLNDVDVLVIPYYMGNEISLEIRNIFEQKGRVFLSFDDTVISSIYAINPSTVAVVGRNIELLNKKISSNLQIEDIGIDILDEFRNLNLEVSKMQNTYSIFKKLVFLINEHISSDNIAIIYSELLMLYKQYKKKSFNKNVVDFLESYAEEIARVSLGL